ncbi:uncharacterized protein [Diabrotica undecimpunctata]|uniref:uncharacterized protein n=1 Tax=Diabrotica undecimpunctata TaxID=50387 RepID=UPI003B636438
MADGIKKSGIGGHMKPKDHEENSKCAEATILKELHDQCGNVLQTTEMNGGVATLVKKSLSAKEFPVTTNLEVVVVEIQSSNRYFICNVYLPSSRQVTYNDLKELFNQIPSSRIIVGDFNSHNIIWGSSYSNARGKIVENIISDFQLNFLNDGSPTRFNINTGNSSAIDLSLCDPALTPRLFWEVLQYTYGSDHHPIVIKNSMALTHDVFIPRWKTETADWLKFENYIDNSMPNCKIAESIDESLHNLNSIIISSAEQFVGKLKKTKNNQTPVPWWNSECGAAIRATKKASWSKYVSEINTSTPVSEVWKKIRKISGLKYTPMISKLKVDNRISTSPQEIANTLAESFREMSSNSNYSDTFLERKIIIENTDLFANDNLNDPLDLPFTFEELENALSELKNTSPGLDDIPNQFYVNQTPVESVTYYNYFGTAVNEEWANNQEIRARIEKARSTFNWMGAFFKSHNFSVSKKLRFDADAGEQKRLNVWISNTKDELKSIPEHRRNSRSVISADERLDESCRNPQPSRGTEIKSMGKRMVASDQYSKTRR